MVVFFFDFLVVCVAFGVGVVLFCCEVLDDFVVGCH